MVSWKEELCFRIRTAGTAHYHTDSRTADCFPWNTTQICSFKLRGCRIWNICMNICRCIRCHLKQIKAWNSDRKRIIGFTMLCWSCAHDLSFQIHQRLQPGLTMSSCIYHNILVNVHSSSHIFTSPVHHQIIEISAQTCKRNCIPADTYTSWKCNLASPENCLVLRVFSLVTCFKPLHFVTAEMTVAPETLSDVLLIISFNTHSAVPDCLCCVVSSSVKLLQKKLCLSSQQG